MLCLSRKVNEAIVIYDPANKEFKAWVTVVEIRGDKVRLGISAPREIVAHRQEVYDAINKGKPQRHRGSVQGGTTEGEAVPTGAGLPRPVQGAAS